MPVSIRAITAHDVRLPLRPGEGVDAVHSNPQYSYAVARLQTASALSGSGLAFTLGGGTDLVCRAIESLSVPLLGQEIEELMAGWGATFRRIADHPQLRWLGPHKGVVHLALAALSNACFDLWAKARGVPLWKLLLELTPVQLVAALDLSYLEDVLPAEEAIALLAREQGAREHRSPILARGYPAYDTSVGWFGYREDELRDKVGRALDAGFGALKLKVGSHDPQRDVRRTSLVRELVGPDVRLMLDANQQWSLPLALRVCGELSAVAPFWIEEPTHPDDVLAHQTLAQAIGPLRIAAGEHLPNRVVFKNYMQAEAAYYLQPDCVRLGGVSEFLTVSLLARKYGLPVVPHVGDMGQIHQHLVLWNHIALGHEALLLEYIPHLREHFVLPADVSGGVYRTPQAPGSSADLLGI